MKYFHPREFPESISLAHPLLLESLDKLRHLIGKPIIPSPAKGALARFTGSKRSLHYVGEGNLSKAVDVFINEDDFTVLCKLLESGLFKGIGYYPDWSYRGLRLSGWHLDLRNKPLIWYRQDNKYYYNTTEDFYKNFYKKLGDNDG